MSQLTTNTTTIDELITMANNLPNAGSGGEDVTTETTVYTNLLYDLEDAVNSLPDAGDSGGGAGVETCTVTITSANSYSNITGIFYNGYENGEITNNSISNMSSNSSVTIEAIKGSAVIVNGYGDATVNAGLEVRTDDFIDFLYYDSNGRNHSKSFRVLEDGAALTFKYNPCFVRGTLISLADGTTKPVEDVTFCDKLLVWDFDNACYASAYPLWIKEKQETKSYYRCTFDNGTVLRLVGSNGRCHRVFSLDRNMFESATECVGERIMTLNGVVKLLSCEVVEETVDFYNIITAHHLNLYADSVLTSCRLNNLYPIESMQFVKEEREVIPLDAYDGVGEVYYKGLRLRERKQKDVSMITEYIANLYKLATTSLYTLM